MNDYKPDDYDLCGAADTGDIEFLNRVSEAFSHLGRNWNGYAPAATTMNLWTVGRWDGGPSPAMDAMLNYRANATPERLLKDVQDISRIAFMFCWLWQEAERKAEGDSDA